MIDFLQPAFLWALPLALAPLLLSFRQRPAPPVVVEFGATVLLARAGQRLQRQAWRRRWLLIIVRVLLLTAIILAFARPIWRAAPRAPQTGASTGVTTVAVGSDRDQYLRAALGVDARSSFDGPVSLVFLGDRAPTDPAALGLRVDGLRTGETAIAAGAVFHPAFANFDETGNALAGIAVRRWWRVEPGERTMVVLRLANGDPFLLEHWSGAGHHLVCTVAPDLAWTDLPLTAGFVSMANELVRYLAAAPAHPPGVATTPSGGDDLRRWLLGLALVLGLAEVRLAGMNAWKLAGMATLLLLLVHPAWRWTRPAPADQGWLTVIDRTDSVRVRSAALTAVVPHLPRGMTLELTGPATDLSSGWTNRPASAVLLVTDGQHNQGPSPVWAALAGGRPVSTLAVGEPGAPPSAAATNSPALPAAAGSATNHGETVSRQLKVFLRHDQPDWEYRHVRHALARDPLVELVDDAVLADTQFDLRGGQTWRLREVSPTAFQRFWSERVRSRAPATLGTPAVTTTNTELERLWRNDALLREVARVSGGRFLTADALGTLPAQPRVLHQVDLREVWWAFAVVTGLCLAAFARQPAPK